MNRLEELLLAYEDETLNEQQRDELKTLLADPAHRAALVDYLHISEMLVTVFSEQEKAKDAQTFEGDPVEVQQGDRPVERRSPITKALPIWNVALAAALIFGIGVYVLFQQIHREPLLATVREVQGDVRAVWADRSVSVKQGTKIMNRSRLLVRGSDSYALLIFTDGSWTRIQGDARVEVRVTERGHRVHIGQGRLLAELKKQKPKQPFVFTTPHASATVLGTRIWLQAQAEATVLRVDRGRVRLTRFLDGQSVLVSGGYSVRASATVKRPLRVRSASLMATLQSRKDKQGPLAQLSFDTREDEAVVRGRESQAKVRLLGRDSRHVGLGDYLTQGRKGAAFRAIQTAVAVDLKQTFAPQHLSVALWMKVTATKTAIDHPVLIDKEIAEKNAGFSLRGFDRDKGRRSNEIRFRIWTDQGLKQLTCEVEKAGEWTHLAVTFDGRVLKMYQNGKQVDSLELGDAHLVHSEKQLTVGRFIGLIDEVTLDDRALSNEQVEKLAAE